MSGYSKLDCNMLHSSIWQEPHDVRVAWVTMLLLTDYHGQVKASLPALAMQNAVTVQRMQEIIEIFMSPDPYSKSKEHDGRRLMEIDGGWQVINYPKYRDGLKQPDRTSAERKARQREKEREEMSRQKRDSHGASRSGTAGHAYSDSDSDSKSEAVKNKKQDTYCPEPQAVSELKEVYALEFPVRPTRKGDPTVWGLTEGKLAEWEDTYADGLDVYDELVRARQWLLDNPGKLKTRTGMTRFLGGWLERAQNRRGGRHTQPAGPINRADPKWMAENDDYTAIGGTRGISEAEYDALAKQYGWDKEGFDEE